MPGITWAIPGLLGDPQCYTQGCLVDYDVPESNQGLGKYLIYLSAPRRASVFNKQKTEYIRRKMKLDPFLYTHTEKPKMD